MCHNTSSVFDDGGPGERACGSISGEPAANDIAHPKSAELGIGAEVVLVLLGQYLGNGNGLEDRHLCFVEKNGLHVIDVFL